MAVCTICFEKFWFFADIHQSNQDHSVIYLLFCTNRVIFAICFSN